LLPGGSQSRVRKALPIQFEPQLAQLRPRQLTRALHHDSERNDLVDVVAYEAREIVEEVFRAIGGAIAASHLGQWVGVMGNGQNRTIALRAPIGVEILQHAAIFGDLVVLGPEFEFRVGHLAVEQIAAMELVDHHEVVLTALQNCLARTRRV
jgi:hypothetical protein